MTARKKPSSQIEKFRATFFDECAERLTDIEELLGKLGQSDAPAQEETLNELFRSVHSIKGGAGAFNFDDIVKVSHAMEAALDLMRSKDVVVDESNIDLLVESRDVLSDIVDRVKSGKKAVAKRLRTVIASLEALSDNVSDPSVATEGPAEEGQPHLAEEPKDGSQPPADPKTYSIKFKPTARLFESANDPLLIVRELKTLGSLKTTVDDRFLPPLTKMNPLESYLVWSFELTTSATPERVAEVFEFVQDACALRIEETPAEGQPTQTIDEETVAEPPRAKPERKPRPAPPPPVPAKETKPTSADDSPAAPVVLAAPAAPASPVQRISSVRVDLDRIDTLVNMVGELVITQAMLEQNMGGEGESSSEKLHRGMETMSSHMRDLQGSVIAVRMQPVKTVFSRMPRLVRELSRKLDKKVKLTLRGEETEVDKTIIELLADPLTHMIRNSLDHGIELPVKRASTGKNEEAEIILSADQRSGRIVIEVADDGAGINRERVLAIAKERGVVATNADLRPENIDDLIFAPGFSTAQEVTDVSGPGVGMDVVRRSIQDLGGRVTAHSVPGEGARFVLSLPLTLAVMDGMIVRVGREKYILPLASIIESLRPTADELQSVMDQAEFLEHRGQYVPLVALASLFGVTEGVIDPSKGLVVFVETGTGLVLGLIVDELVGQRQVVIKSLEENFLRIEGVSAATILGDGRVALILDVDGLEGMIAPVRGLRDTATVSPTAENEVTL